MKKKVWKHISAVLCMALCLSVCFNGILSVQADTANARATVSDGNAGGSVSDGDVETDVTKEPTITAEWADGWKANVTYDRGSYTYENGYTFSMLWAQPAQNEETLVLPIYDYSYIDNGGCFDLSVAIHESGFYQPYGFLWLREGMDFSTMKAVSVYGEAKEYVRPAQEMEQVTVAWDTTDGYKATFTTVDNAKCYYVYLYTENDKNEFTSTFFGDGANIVNQSSEETITVDFTNYIQTEGRYKVGVYTISQDIDTIANSREAVTTVLDTKTYTTEVANGLSDILADATSAEAAKEEVMDAYTVNGLVAAMQTDSDVVDLIESLENQYVEEKGIEVLTKVSEDAGAYVDTSAVDIVGAGLNASGSQIVLDISVPEESETITSSYEKSVVLDIKLLDGNTELHELDIPVTITMSIPEGISAENLVLIHYTSGGKEVVKCISNSDGTITFTVGSFSLFEFADSTTLDDGTDDSGNTDSGNTDSGNTDSGNTDSGNTDSGNTDSGNTDSGNTDSGNTDSGNTDSGNTDSGNTGSGNNNSGNAGNSNTSGNANTNTGNTTTTGGNTESNTADNSNTTATVTPASPKTSDASVNPLWLVMIAIASVFCAMKFYKSNRVNK